VRKNEKQDRKNKIKFKGDTCDPQTGPPRDKEQCKNNGWMRFDTPRRFKNQGECIQFVNTGK
jgi:hypothetical protein